MEPLHERNAAEVDGIRAEQCDQREDAVEEHPQARSHGANVALLNGRSGRGGVRGHWIGVAGTGSGCSYSRFRKISMPRFVKYLLTLVVVLLLAGGGAFILKHRKASPPAEDYASAMIAGK